MFIWHTRKTVSLILSAIALVCGPTVPAHATEFTDRCAGYGSLNTSYLMNWEAGLGIWTVSRSSVVSQSTFDTPDWTVVGGLPDGRAGFAAFVADLVAGDCGTDDETGLLHLQSPSIDIPAGVGVPRVSVDHWFETEFGWDGGQILISINGGPWSLLPSTAFEQFPYNTTLEPALDEFGVESNTNPMAGMRAFSGTIDGRPTGQWVQSRINLLGLADAGDSVRFRFDFGIDNCTVSPIDAVGWFIGDFELYHCEAELPPSNCGNGVIDGPEECDDGNRKIGDGCSNVCVIEPGWLCELPTPSTPVDDYSFEAGTPNPFWTEFSDTFLGTPICDAATCGSPNNTGPAHGSFWAYFGGFLSGAKGSVSQTVTIPPTARTLAFQLGLPRCDTASDYLEVLIDGNQELVINGEDPACDIPGYQTRTVDISPYADGGVHTLEFYSETFGLGDGIQMFFVDAVELPANPSYCRLNGTSLILTKRVFNDDGGQAYPTDWTLEASGPSQLGGSGPVVQSGDGFLPGTYSLSEFGPTGYSGIGWSCEGGTQINANTVDIAENEAVECTLLNEDVSPSITVIKSIVNDSGGTIDDPNVFGLKIDYEPVQHGDPAFVTAGDHELSEFGHAGYLPGDWGGDCTPDGTITLGLGEAATCTLSNDDIPASLTLVKTIVNDDDGTVEDPNAFELQVDGLTVLDGAANIVSAGNHQASELGHPGYLPGTWSGDCDPDGNISLSLGQEAICSITNDDVDRTRLDLAILVTNDDGGSETVSSWQLVASGPAGFSGPGPSVSSGKGLPPGTYDLSIDGPVVYGASDWVCSGSGVQNDADTITLTVDEVATCTISVDDIAPTLTVVKNVVNDNGGDVNDPDAFGLRVDGIAVPHDIAATFDAGLHTVSEIGLPGYQAGNWTGHCNPDGSITLQLAQNYTCSITNDDIAPSITVLKTIINDNGGTVENPDLFGLMLDGITVSHGVSNSVTAGLHTVSETGISGYQPGAWGGDCAIDGTVTVTIGQNAVCTITNDDIAPTLTVLNTVITDDQGSISDPNAFDLKIDGNPVLHGEANVLNAGSHVVSQTAIQGYQASSWSGDCDAFGTISLDPGENATCTITNDDSGNTQLTLVIEVNNDAGGSNSSGDWTLSATGPSSFDGQGPTVIGGPGLTPGTYQLAQSGPEGYESGDWNCTGGTQVNGDSITLELGESATCSLTKDDIAPTITLVKTIVNDNGGTVDDPNVFGLLIDGFAVSHNVPFTTFAGSHTALEIGVPGYATSAWGGDCSTDGSITVSVGQDAVCTNESDDISPRLTIDKTVINDSGGLVTDPDAFGLLINGLEALDETEYLVDAGNHTVSEVGLSGYVPDNWGGDCNPDGSITLRLAQVATCTITNDDINDTSLTLVKQVINNNGGTASGSDWTLNASGPDSFGGPGPSVTGGPALTAGDYVLSESGGPSGYIASNWSCNGGVLLGDTITLASGNVVTCTITNDDTDTTSLTLVLELSNDSGGTALLSEWILSAAGPTEFSGSGPTVFNGPSFSAGVYDLASSGPAGYAMSDWSCVGAIQDDADTVTLALGDTATCTVQADDMAAQLTVIKTILNNNGGNVTDENVFGLRVDSVPVLHNVPGPLDAGEHTVSEDGLAGYLGGAWGGDCAPDGSITLELGEIAECTVTNDDIAPSLTVLNTITNDNGGTVINPDMFALKVDGGLVSNGVANVLEAGLHLVSQDSQDGYVASVWGGDCNADGSIALSLAQNAVCTITNDDSPPSLTLVKEVTNDNGGESVPSAWTLSAAGTSPLNGPGPIVTSGSTFQAGSYDLSESGGEPGYEASDWVCVGGSQADADTISLTIGEIATCTITNDDIGPKLTLVNTVLNDNGGSVDNPNEFGLKIDDEPVLNNTPVDVDAGNHAAGMDGYAGYEISNWGGDCAADGSITLALAQEATCSVTSDDIAPLLTVSKTVINDNGGTVIDPNAFELKVDGSPVTHGVPVELDAGNHTASEEGQDGYEASTWGGDCFPDGSISLSVGDEAICTITNDDREPSLTLVKQIVNEYGGDASPSDWTISASGPGNLSGPGPIISSNPGFEAGTYALSESEGAAGYVSGDWNCVGGTQIDSVTIAIELGESVTCTITSQDIAPTLTLLKTVINDNGGTVTDPDAFGLMIDGEIVLHGTPTELNAGTHTASEVGLPGYAAQSWGGECSATGVIELEVGQDAMCTLTNDDKSPSLTLVNVVYNDNGGTASASDWILEASGPLPGNSSGFSGPGPVVSGGANFEVGTYDLTVSGGETGYTIGNWSCIGGAQADADTVILEPGSLATCRISQDDDPPVLTLIKTVVNDNGGSAQPSDWTLVASGPTSFSGPGPQVESGANFDAGIYDLSETDGPGGYIAGDWSCTGDFQLDLDTIQLGNGEFATCTLINTFDAPPIIFRDGFESP
ncbi:MAG: hypothetical protein HKO85_01230 [Xanthomonadales bacterium]|nr:hypothetical protein [Xanthomonadales bacterium]